MELPKVIAEVDLRALTHNLDVAAEKTGGKDVMAVVKADAYGHGAFDVSEHLIRKGVSRLGTAFTGEAVALREAGIQVPISVFFDRGNAEQCLRYNLTPTVSDLPSAKNLDAAARRQNTKIPVHVKVDTGMGRIGFTMESALKDITSLASMKNIRLEGLMSHFSDADLKDKKSANAQLKKFRSIIGDLKKRGITFERHHIANSAAVMSMKSAHFDMVRPGIMLYGYAYPGARGIRPVMTLRSNIILLKSVPEGTTISYGRTFTAKRRSTIATIPIGYADGYNRLLSNRGEVLIKGKRAPVVGRVCMDTIMVDVTGIPGVSYKSPVVLLGSQGKDKITADELAAKTGTIPYEILTSIGQRVKRVYRR